MFTDLVLRLPGLDMGCIILKPNRDKSIRRNHPWIFSGAIGRVEHVSANGETVDVLSAEGQWLARGAYSYQSQIRVRVWTFNPDQEINSEFIRDRLQRAIAARNLLFPDQNITGLRLVNSESDNLPGLIIDRYDHFLVCQFLSAGAEYWKQVILDHVNDLFPAFGIYERSDGDIRLKEGLTPRTGILSGPPPPKFVEIQEGPLRFLVDIINGHKTGFYLDQRENRAMLIEFSQNTTVLNCFSYTGSFGIWALSGGAKKVINIDSSSVWLHLARYHVEINDFNPDDIINISGDAFKILRKFRDEGKKFDLVILDPPKFAETSSQVPQASRGYKDINWLAFKLIPPGGVLITFSCSGHVPLDLFQKIVADAALDAGREAQIIRYLSQAADHPTALNFPESNYLKGLICRVW